MSLRKIKSNELFVNQIEFNPNINFYVNNSVVYYNQNPQISGNFSTNLLNVPVGHISLYEENVDRQQNNLIYPFITKDGSLTSFKTITTSNFSSDFLYGDVVTGSYPLSSSISRDYYSYAEDRPRVDALRNTLNYYSHFSNHYSYSSSLGDKSLDILNLISIPSIFYGSSIKKGTINLDFYSSGTLVGRLQDEKRNGELIQTLPSGSTGSGSIAGVVLYTEGFIVLTGSWSLTSDANYSWVNFGAGIQGSGIYPADFLASSSSDITFKGTSKVPVMTLFAHAKRGEVNNSLNPTFIDYNYRKLPITGSSVYIENHETYPSNVVSGAYNQEEYLEKTTFITSIKLYDENKNVIGIAKLSKPVKKTQDRDLTFKLKIDF